MYKDIFFLDGIQPDFLQSIENFISEWESDSDEIIVQTSGSTGKPKELRLKKKDVVSSANATGAYFNFEEGQGILLNLSTEHIAGKLIVVRAIEYKMKLLVAPLNSNPLKNSDDFPFEINFGAFVPYQVDQILKDPKSKNCYEKIENVIIGGAKLNLDLEKKLKSLKNQSYTSFGMTETITHFALKNIKSNEPHYSCLEGAEISQDERGCLVIEQLYSKSNRIVSNDIIELLDKKSFLWKGRLDNIINSGGIKINPEQIEIKIEKYLRGEKFYISSIKDNELGESAVLIIQKRVESKINDAVLLSQLKAVLEKYNAPSKIIYVSLINETKNGKIIREKF